MSPSCGCTRCTPTTDLPALSASHDPVELPEKPRPFRVHSSDDRTQDCTLHPDGRMTMQINGEALTSMLSFDEMRERNWAAAHIEWDPQTPPGEGGTACP